ncbi:MAG: cupin domain-containing protein [Pseudorhodoplanes sp.]
MEPIASFKAARSLAPKLDAWPDFATILSGQPNQAGHFATNSPGELVTGIWECACGKFVVDPFFADVNEFAYLLEGKLRISSDKGDTATYSAGDCIVTPMGFKGTWEVLEPIRKVFAIRKR